MMKQKGVGAGRKTMVTNDPHNQTAMPIDILDADPATDATDTRDTVPARQKAQGGGLEAETPTAVEIGTETEIENQDVDGRAKEKRILAADGMATGTTTKTTNKSSSGTL